MMKNDEFRCIIPPYNENEKTSFELWVQLWTNLSTIHPDCIAETCKKMRFFWYHTLIEKTKNFCNFSWISTTSRFNCTKSAFFVQKYKNTIMYTTVKVKTYIFGVQNPLSIFKKSKKVEKIAFKESKNSNYEKTCRNFCRIFCVRIRSWSKFLETKNFWAPQKLKTS